MDLKLKDKVIIVTGATKGIGRAAVQAFAEEGARLTLAARTADDLDQTAREVREATGAEVVTAVCDVTTDIDVQRLVHTAMDAYGRVDVLVNSGAGRLPAGEFLEITSEQWLEGWNQKIQAYIRTAQAVFPIMEQQGSGKIINVVGTAARNPKHSYMAVGMSNAALVNFTKSLADRGAPHGILVAGVAPSGVMTERWTRLIAARAEAEGKTAEQLQAESDAGFPLGRMGNPQELGDVICFVASERASFVSGSIITVDGNSTQGVFN